MKKTVKSVVCILLAVIMLFSNEGFIRAAQAISSISESNRPSTKKGIQIAPAEMDKALELGCKTIFVNFNFSDFVSVVSKKGENTWTYKKKTYGVDTTVLASYNDWFNYGRNNGIETIYVQVMTGSLPGLSDTTASNAAYHAFDTWTTAGVENVTKMYELLNKYMGSNVDFWIIGNEVDNPHVYYEMGSVSEEKFAKNYEAAMRIMNTQAKKYNPKARVMACFDFFWSYSQDNYVNVKNLFDRLVTLTASDNYDWGVAIHPYPAPLTSANFADDYNTGMVSNDENTKVITMCNLEVFTDYCQKVVNQFNGGVRPIAITEIGFTAYEGGVYEDQTAQAAYYAYAYYKAEANKFIDAFEMRSYADAAVEAQQGLYFGLYDQNGKKRQIYDVMKNIDTKNGNSYTDKYLPFLGAESWGDLVKDYFTIPFVNEANYNGLFYDSIKRNHVYLTNGVIDTSVSGLIASNGYIAYIVKGIGVDAYNYIYTVGIKDKNTVLKVDVRDDTKVSFYFVDNESVAKVSASGKVTPVNSGMTYIDIISDNGKNTGLAMVGLKIRAAFKDVSEKSWYSDYVDILNGRGIMTGTTKSTFSPDMNLTRGQIATILWRLEGSPEVSAVNEFPDVPDGKYYSKAVLWAKSVGIVNGYNTGVFAPEDNVIRQDFALMLMRYATYKKFDTTVTDTSSYKACSDYMKVSKYARPAAQWAYNCKIMGVNSDLRPGYAISRCEAAAMVVRFLNAFGL